MVLSTCFDHLAKNDFDSPVDLSSYTSSTPYECPCDGFFVGYGGTGYIKGGGKGATSNDEFGFYAGSDQYATIPVKKGMRLYKIYGSGAINFRPYK